MAEKRQSIKTVDGEKLANGIYEARFKSGTVFTGDTAAIPAEHRETMLARFMQYGLKQKLDDSMAGADDEADALEELKSTWDAILAGKWTLRVAGEGVEGGLFARALAEVKGWTLAEAKGKIAELVTKNLEANRKAQEGKENAPEISERQVFNRLREVYLERDPALKAKYDELKAKKAAKQKAKGSNIEIGDL